MPENIRKQIARAIQLIDPLDQEECTHQERALQWLASGAEIFRIKKPATPDTHLVSYFLPIDEKEKKLLLVHHKNADMWLPPGGHVDPGEHPKDTVSREMQEELFSTAQFIIDHPTFITITKTRNDPKPHTDVTLWYLVSGDVNKEYSFDPREFYEICWFPIENLPTERIEPHLFRFINKLGSMAMGSYTNCKN